MASSKIYKGYTIKEGGLTGGRWSDGVLVDQHISFQVVHPDGAVDGEIYLSVEEAEKAIDRHIKPIDYNKLMS